MITWWVVGEGADAFFPPDVKSELSHLHMTGNCIKMSPSVSVYHSKRLRKSILGQSVCRPSVLYYPVSSVLVRLTSALTIAFFKEKCFFCGVLVETIEFPKNAGREFLVKYS